MGERTKLAGGLEKTATWVWLDPADGQLNVEYYDFSSAAQANSRPIWSNLLKTRGMPSLLSRDSSATEWGSRES